MVLGRSWLYGYVFWGYLSVPLLVIPIVCLPMELESCACHYRQTLLFEQRYHNSTKAAVSDEFEKFLTTADYKIRIVQQSDTVQSYDRFDEMPSEIELKEGVYTLIASKGDNLPSAFENPYFEGSTDFTVKADMSTPIDVTCTLGNARITVDYTEDFKEAYSDYTVLLSSAFTSGSLEIKKDEMRPAYMQVAKEGSELGIAIRLKKITEDKEKHIKSRLLFLSNVARTFA